MFNLTFELGNHIFYPADYTLWNAKERTPHNYARTVPEHLEGNVHLPPFNSM